ncbi:MAG: hypothetical protein IPM51_16400 [Sphingobacteriaceae bacterium]|nr:hypothetical protein [Sphingobacteriaceae bacterium]
MRFILTGFLYTLIFFLQSACAQNPAPHNKPTVNHLDSCPLEGNAKSKHLQALNLLKNRTQFPNAENFDANISLKAVLAKGEDSKRWSTHSAAKITGYVKDVKVGGIETCNCKTKDKNLRDTHIDLVLNPNSYDKKEVMVIEVTPRIRKIMAAKGIDWSTKMLRAKYLGRWIEVEGWMLFDEEHDNMAENTKPGNPKNWRGTAWEIHPITSIKIADKH